MNHADIVKLKEIQQIIIVLHVVIHIRLNYQLVLIIIVFQIVTAYIILMKIIYIIV